MSDEKITEQQVDEAPEVDAAPDLAKLSFEELSALEDALVEEFESRSNSQEFSPSPENMQELRDVVEALDTVREFAAARQEFALLKESVGGTSVQDFAVTADATPAETEAVEAEATEQEFDADELAEFEAFKAFKKAKGKGDSEEEEFSAETVEAPAETEETETIEEAPAAEDTKESAVTEEAVQAAAEISPEGLASNTVPASPKRDMGITASADVPGYTPGQALDGLQQVAEALVAKRSKVRGTDVANDGYQYLVASMKTGDYDEAHTLGSDPLVNLARIEQATSPEGQALIASGGIKAMLTPYYELTVFGDSVRPVRDSLIGYKADRGGIRYMPAPTLEVVNPGVNVYAESVDASATPYGGTGKGTVTVTAGSEQQKMIDVIPRIMKVGNLMARTYPELVAAWTKLLLAQHARAAETNLLDHIVGDSTAVTAAKTYGVTQSLLPQVDQLVAAYRSRHRIASGLKFRAIFPFWLKDMIRSDIARRQFGADAVIPDSEIDRYFSVRGVNVTWHLDTSSTTDAIFGAQTAGAYLKYPGTVEWFLFPEGSWLFLDGGSLDLGLVRDSTLNSTNDYTIFAETFESAVRVGPQSLKVISTLFPDGSTAGPATIIT